MIDLSHLTEEEQGAILTVLRRDQELKKSEGERIRKLEKGLNSSSQSKLKYLTGEWFYEAKSRRHRDKIHGSEIILASMKQRRSAGLEGSLRMERAKPPGGRSSDGVPPPKPARCLEVAPPQQMNDAEKENLNSGLRSPRMRHNPFNRASLIAVDPPENNTDMSSDRGGDSPKQELISPLKNHPADQRAQTSGGSVTSGSSLGFRPVPKKRTFLSRRSQSESNDSQGLESSARPGGVVPAPRRSLQQGSSGSSNQSLKKSRDDASAAFPPTQRPPSKVSSDASLEPEKKSPSTARDRPSTDTRGEALTGNETQKKREEQDQTRREQAGMKTVILPMDVFQDRGSETSSGVVKGTAQDELSLTRSIVDPVPPVSYDLNFIDKPDPQVQYKSNPKHVFALSAQATEPVDEEDDSIAKVLDWFNRSTDSSEWLETEDGPEATRSSEDPAELDRINHKDSQRKDVVGVYEREETLRMKRRVLQKQNKEQNKTEEKAMKERIRPQEIEESDDDWQSPKMSHLKSFWEKSNTGPKILIGKSNTTNTGQKPVPLPVEKDEEGRNKHHGVSDIPSGRNNRKGNYDKYASNHVSDREEPPQTDTEDRVHSNINPLDPLLLNGSTQRKDLTHNTNNPKVLFNLQEVRVTPEFQSFSLVKPNHQPHGGSQLQETPQPEVLPKTMDVALKTRDSPEKIALFRNSPSTDHKQRDDAAQINPKEKVCRSLSEDVKTKDKEDKDSNSNRQDVQQENTAEKIKQLKSFWEQEMNRPMFYTGKPKTQGDGKVNRGASRGRLNKRFTKSEYDLRSVGNDSDDSGEGFNRNPSNFTVLPLNQRIENSSPSLSMSRSNFNTLRDFWDEATSDTRSPLSFDKPKTPKRRESVNSQMPSQESKLDSEVHSSVDKTRSAAMKSSPPPQNRSKSPHDRQTGSRSASDSKTSSQLSFTATESKRSSKDFTREERPSKPQINPGKETRSPKGRKDGFGSSSSRSSLRRATSMFALSDPEEKDQGQLKMDPSPVHSQRKERLNADRGSMLRKSSDETEPPLPRARAFVPRDYRHYLGMTDAASVHASLAPAAKEEGPHDKSAFDFNLSSPLRASTPAGSEERYSRKASKTSQRPLWANYSGSDTGQESSLSSTSETWSLSRNSSNRDNDESHNPVRKALRRAEARPKNLAKSMEDITASSSARQERKQEPTADMRRISDASTVPSTSSSLFSDPDQLKKMSKSVPSLQKEDADLDSDSTFEDPRRKATMGRSMTNLTNSSGMTSVSSLSGSVMTMYSGDFGNVEVQGNIQFSINYIQRLREFHIFVAECRDLAAVDQKRARSDPYVKSYLVPDKDNLGKRKTSVKKKTLNPKFNEILRYRVRMEYLRTQTLILSVWHHDTFGRNSFLGEVDVDLSNWDFDHTQMNYLPLKPRNMPSLAPSNDRGEMRLAIRFLPQITRSEGFSKGTSNFGEIHIWVKECKNLPLVRTTIDPYVKCFVLPDTSRKSRQKTRVLRRTADPAFNHTMVYDGIREADLTEACIELTVWDRDRLASNLLGGLRIGSGSGRSYGAAVDWMDSTSYEASLWERMMASPNEWVEDVLPLRTLSSAKTTLK